MHFNFCSIVIVESPDLIQWLCLVKYVQRKPAFSAPLPADGQTLMFIHPMKRQVLSFRVEKSLSFPSGARSPEVRAKGRKLEASTWAQPAPRTSLLADHHSPGEKGSPWGGWALLLWLSVSPGSASDHLATCLLDFGLDLRGRLPRAKSPSKIYLLPDSKPQIAPAQQCGW